MHRTREVPVTTLSRPEQAQVPEVVVTTTATCSLQHLPCLLHLPHLPLLQQGSWRVCQAFASWPPGISVAAALYKTCTRSSRHTLYPQPRIFIAGFHRFNTLLESAKRSWIIIHLPFASIPPLHSFKLRNEVIQHLPRHCGYHRLCQLRHCYL
jgi:hypothetical protein